MCYADNIRQSEPLRNKPRHVSHNVNVQEPEFRPRLCYICHRPGHVAKYCYRRDKSSSNPKNM